MSRKQKRSLFRILIAAALLAAACLLPLEGWARLALFLVPYALVGWDVLWTALRNILHGQLFDENFLMTLAAAGALATGEYPEAVAVMLLYQVGELFQSVAVGKSRRSIAALMDIRPDRATVLRDGAELSVEPEEVAVGEVILVRPGEKIPLDGLILEGRTSVNTAALTGEALPRDLGPGERVISGSVNIEGLIRVQVASVYEESTVARILELVESSAAKKAKTENFITRFARWYTPCVVIAAALLAVLPPLLLGGAWKDWIYRAMSFLVVSCPCALVISVPLSFFGGIGGASRAGILIKGGNYLEALARVDCAVFDKTGTLTQGSFTVTALYPEGIPPEELLEKAALAESFSTHPIAESIRAACAKAPDKSRVSRVTELPGLGLEAEVEGHLLLAGNAKLMARAGLSPAPRAETGTLVHIAEDGRYLGCLLIADRVKPGAAAAIAALKKQGVKKLVMLTGDREAAGRAVAAELGLDEVHTELLPGDKVKIVERLLAEKSGKGSLAFVGDGINDAPVLSRADVGIAMGALGSDAAIEAADVVLMDDDPGKLARALSIARRTMGIVVQNIAFALGVKAAVLVLTALGVTGMWLAIFADVGVAVLAILNAMRTLKS